MRCSRCGNENPATNRFCGMCGTSLLQAPTPVQATGAAKPPVTVPATGVGVPAAAPAPAAVTKAAAPAVSPSAAPAGRIASAPAPPLSIEEIRAIAGISAPPPTAPAPATADETLRASVPSFLGLNEPVPSARRRANPLSIDPHAGPSSGNLDYLLEDEAEPKSGGAWKFVLIVIALALAAGFGYLRWKGQGVPRLAGEGNKPPAAVQNSEAPDASAPAPSPSGSASPSPNAAASQPGSSPAATDSAGNPNSASPTPGSASSANPGSTSPSTTPAATGAPASPAPDTSAGNAAAQPPAAASPADTTPATAPPAATPKPAPAKPTPALAAADPVARAERYIYGKGVAQDCDRGMRILKPAVDQGNSKAMVEMGALYSAGLCTPRDLPTAYRWFALALRKDPNNESLQADLNKLWGEMTQPERQLAIRLSQ